MQQVMVIIEAAARRDGEEIPLCANAAEPDTNIISPTGTPLISVAAAVAAAQQRQRVLRWPRDTYVPAEK